MGALPRYLGQLGYECNAVHAYQDWVYNRQNVYQYFGFDRFITIDSFDPKTDIRPTQMYISDMATADMVIAQFEQHLAQKPGTPFFNFTVTIQAHGPYEDKTAEVDNLFYNKGLDISNANRLNNYLVRIRETDAALGRLSEYLNTLDEPAILLFFGDHLPYLGPNHETFNYLGYSITDPDQPLESWVRRYKTPYIIWANTAARQNMEPTVLTKDEISVNYLAATLLDYAGLPKSAFFKFVYGAMEQLPVISHTYYKADQGDYTLELTPEQRVLLNEYEILQYYMINDERIEKEG